MKIFVKYIITSMLEKKSRFILLLIAISISTGFLITSMGVVDIAINSYTKPLIEGYGNKEVLINSKGEEKFYSLEGLKLNGVTNIQSEIYIGGYYNYDNEIKNLNIHGRDDKSLEDIQLISGNIEGFIDNTCIISKRISDEHNINVDDNIDVIIGGQSKKLKIAAIASNNDIYYNDTIGRFSIILPYKYLSEDLGVYGKYNLILADGTEDTIEDSISKFNENNSDFESEKLYNLDSIKKQASSFVYTMYLMLTITLFMSAIILYGSIKLTITERLPVIGTFLSQGATFKIIEKILYVESIIYGLLGGLVGNIISIFALKGISRYISPLKSYGIYDTFSIPKYYFIIGILFAVLLSIISAIIPVIKIRNLQVKEVILNNVNTTMHIGLLRFVIGIILIVVSIVISTIENEFINMISILFVLISVIGVVLTYPKVIDIALNFLCKIFKGRLNTIFLALNNLRTSKVLLSNITLIVISILSVLLINSISSTIKIMLTDAYTGLNYNIAISGISNIRNNDISVEDEIKEILKQDENIDFNSVQSIIRTIATIDKKEFLVEGIDGHKYKNYNEYLELKGMENNSTFTDFINSKDKEILITTKDAKLINKNKGDIVKIEVNGICKDYKISGVIEGKFYNGGMFVLIKDKDIKEDFQINSANLLIFKTNINEETVKDNIKTNMSSFGAATTTRGEAMKIDEENNNLLVNILGIFAYMAVIIASLGVLNNITIGFIQRKRDFAVLSSVGMTNNKRNLMLLTESFLSVVLSLLISLSVIGLELNLISKFLKVINLPLDITLDTKTIPICFIISLVVILIATMPVIFKSKKLSIIQELRYE